MTAFALTADAAAARERRAAELARRISPATQVRPGEPLARHTTLRVGGPADIYVEPASEADLGAVLDFCAEFKLSWLLLGRGSNLLVRDGGFRGVAICLTHPGFAAIEVCGPDLRCGAGARLKAVALEARRHDLAGFEFLEGIPGTVGGGLRMNAGAMGGCLFDLVVSIRCMDRKGLVRELPRASVEVNYRQCPTLKTEIALEALLRGRTGPQAEIDARMKQFSSRRRQSQPAAPSAGCIFKNPPTIPAGKLIDELGLKGARVGGALVSVEHGNFIVNDRNATAAEILELIELIRARARTQRGIALETEVEIVGE